jgi:hypothetical protein
VDAVGFAESNRDGSASPAAADYPAQPHPATPQSPGIPLRPVSAAATFIDAGAAATVA